MLTTTETQMLTNECYKLVGPDNEGVSISAVSKKLLGKTSDEASQSVNPLIKKLAEKRKECLETSLKTYTSATNELNGELEKMQKSGSTPEQISNYFISTSDRLDTERTQRNLNCSLAYNKGVGKVIGDAKPAQIPAILKTISDVGNFFKNAYKIIAKAITALVKKVSEIVMSVVNFFKKVAKEIEHFFSNVINKIGSIF